MSHDLHALKLESEKDRCVFHAYALMHERAAYYAASMKHDDLIRANTYESAADMLYYAMLNDWESLNQFPTYEN